ncbi:hypothetical protein [Poseidonocella sp. HB161398]|uniref:hypothetical protein n=1 Tax=Poseidonocella sp. HB161398 TaxID=2320855 RepID=UPI001108AA31|nr:hypothetical protein [Poseidonocella sp. HB161398]
MEVFFRSLPELIGFRLAASRAGCGAGARQRSHADLDAFAPTLPVKMRMLDTALHFLPPLFQRCGNKPDAAERPGK